MLYLFNRIVQFCLDILLAVPSKYIYNLTPLYLINATLAKPPSSCTWIFASYLVSILLPLQYFCGQISAPGQVILFQNKLDCHSSTLCPFTFYSIYPH